MSIHINIQYIASFLVLDMISQLEEEGYSFEPLISKETDVELYKNTLVVNEQEGIVYVDGGELANSISFEEYKRTKK